MASKSLGTLTLDILAKTGQFVAGMDKAGRTAKKTFNEISKYGKQMAKYTAGAATAAAGALVYMVNQSRNAIDAQAKLATQYRTTYESLTILNRAGELAGIDMEAISKASKALEMNMANAAQGTKAQVDAFAKLNINAKELSKLSLDKRIEMINKALKDNVSETERAAVAADIYGAKNALAMQTIDPDTIARAAHEVKILGTALSEVDAQKIQIANDSFSVVQEGIKGFSDQLAVQFAPALQLIGDKFFSAAEEAGGMGKVAEKVFDVMLTGAAFVIDVLDGLKRYVTIAANVWVMAFAGIGKSVGKVYDMFGKKKNQKMLDAEASFVNAAKNIRDSLEKPLAGTVFLEGVKKAQVALEAEAKAALAAADAKQIGDEKAAAAMAEIIRKEEEARKAREEADEEAQQQEENRKKRLESLANDVASMEDSYKRQIAAVDKLSEAEKIRYELTSGKLVGINAEQQKRLEGLAAEVDMMEKMAGINSEAQSIADSLKSEEEKLEESYERRRQIILDNTLITGEAQTKLLEDLEADRMERLAAMEAERSQMILEGSQQLFDSLAGIAEAFGGKQSAIYKAMFAASKAFAIADAIIKIQQGIASAAAIPFPANLPAMASVVAATGSIVNTISGTQMQGMAHDGIMSVPQTGTWLLQKGERVTTAETSAKLDRTLDTIQRGGGGGGVNQVINVQGRIDARTSSQLATDAARRQRMASARLGG
jgi:hypothetical protein